MERFKFIFWTISLMILGAVAVIGQDSLYAKKIDSLWLKTYSRHLLSEKKERIGETKFSYYFYKQSNEVRSLTALSRSTGEHILYFYLHDKIVMISPVGQQPYYVLDEKLVYAKEMKHSLEEILKLIARANKLLFQAYKKRRLK